jgi:hypothetical protein
MNSDHSIFTGLQSQDAHFNSSNELSTSFQAKVLSAIAAILLLFTTTAANAVEVVVDTNDCQDLIDAIEDANGGDIIKIVLPPENNTIFMGGCSTALDNTPSVDHFHATVNASITIEGNGATVFGAASTSWVSGQTGFIAPKRCPDLTQGDVITGTNPGFLKINPGLTVKVNDLTISELNTIARVNKGATLELDNVDASDIKNFYKKCELGAIEVLEEANLTIKNSDWFGVQSYPKPANTIAVYQSAIHGFEAGNLLIENSTFNASGTDGLIAWEGGNGSRIDIVSSQLLESGGMIASGKAETNIVNSIWSPSGALPSDKMSNRLWNLSSNAMNITASTLLLADVSCDNVCQAAARTDPDSTDDWGWIKIDTGAAAINFKETAIGVNFPLYGIDDSTLTLGRILDDDRQRGSFTADPYTWIQPAGQQDSNDLIAITNQGELKTDAPGLRTGISPGANISQFWAHPLTGSASDPGQLINKIDNIANPLTNPVSGNPIEFDVLGNERVDGNSKRDIGAVQLQLVPNLNVFSVESTSVGLVWNKPQDPDAGQINGYVIYYRLNVPNEGYTLIQVFGANTTKSTVDGLANGKEYEFRVAAAIDQSQVSPLSNPVLVTPLDDLNTPQVTAIAGVHQVDLSWTKPEVFGREINSYLVVYRKKGMKTWENSTTVPPGQLSLTLGNLKGGVVYEFGVAASTTAGNTDFGIVNAKPTGDVKAPVVSAIPGDGNVTLNWNGPSNGDPVCFYVVLYRPEGLIYWPSGNEQILPSTATTTVIDGLDNAITYEFGVAAVVPDPDNSSGTPCDVSISGPLGLVSAKPGDNTGGGDPVSRPAGNKENEPKYWEQQGYGECTKTELDDNYGSTWILSQDASALILKSGRTNDIWESPDAGEYSTVSGKDISHVIVCSREEG